MVFVPVNRNICQFEIAECCPDVLGMESFDLAHFYSDTCAFNDEFYISKKLPRSPSVKCFIIEQKLLHDHIIHIVEQFHLYMCCSRVKSPNQSTILKLCFIVLRKLALLTLQIVQCTLYTVHRTLYIVQYGSREHTSWRLNKIHLLMKLSVFGCISSEGHIIHVSSNTMKVLSQFLKSFKVDIVDLES